jgi:uncharacterized membrane protein (Fun14 family)
MSFYGFISEKTNGTIHHIVSNVSVGCEPLMIFFLKKVGVLRIITLKYSSLKTNIADIVLNLRLKHLAIYLKK